MSFRQSEVRQSVCEPATELSATDIMAQAVALHCRHESEVVRSGAASALAEVGNASVATELHSLLVDEDPDVRVDAMHALVRCARLDDAPMIRASLIGDPEFDVKKAAVAALAAVEDRGAVDLLCQLVTDRCDELVSWDESSHDWDEWLDLQPFVIKALGSIGDDRCIGPLLSLCSDEPECESFVFHALMQVGDKGVSQVMTFLDDARSGSRERVVRVIRQSRPELLLSHVDRLMNDDDPRLRIIGLNCPDVAPSVIRDIAAKDPDDKVRFAGIERLNIEREDDNRILRAALNDPCAAVRMKALELGMSYDAIDIDTLPDDTRRLLNNDNESELVLSPPACLQLMGDSAVTELSNWVTLEDAPLERRIYAATVLGLVPSLNTLRVISDGLVDRAQQMRVACMNVILDWMQMPDEALAANNPERDGESSETLRPLMLSILQRTINGELMLSSTSINNDEPKAQPIRWHNTATVADDTTTDDLTAGSIEHDSTPQIQSSPLSTLEAIEQAARRPSSNHPQTQAVETNDSDGADDHFSKADAVSAVPDDSVVDDIKQTKGARRRVSIEGPEDFQQSLRCLALMMCAQLPDKEIERATIVALEDTSDEIVETTLRALHERYSLIDDSKQHVSGELIGMLMTKLTHQRQGVRYWAASVLLLTLDGSASSGHGLVDTLMRDDDALCRSLAMRHAKGEQLCQGLTDSSSIVRSAAIDSVLERPGKVSLKTVIDILEQGQTDDTLRRLIARSPESKATIAERLMASEIQSNSLNTLLRALAAA